MILSIALLVASLYGDTPDAKHAWAVHDWNRPKPGKVEPAESPGGAPSDAVVLFDGSKESFERNWCDAKGGPSKWRLGAEGDFFCETGYVNGGDIYTRQEFGDCQFHIEYRHEKDVDDLGRSSQWRGNSGVFFMGPDTGHEIQILESYYTSAEMEGRSGFVDNYADGQAGAVYAENPPMVNPARKPGEWQVYDIIFHQPVWDGLRLSHPGSVTVFFNGVLVQDAWEFEGVTTHCVRKPLVPHKTRERMMLQDHGCRVHFRNIWCRPIPSRWSNRTHSIMAGDENDVMKLRRETAARLYGKIADKDASDARTLCALAEVVSYANEAPYRGKFKDALSAFRQNPGTDAEIEAVNGSLDVLVRNGILPPDARIVRQR